MSRLLLIILCFFFPFIAVLIHDRLSVKVLWAFLLQLVGHIPGVIYGIPGDPRLKTPRVALPRSIRFPHARYGSVHRSGDVDGGRPQRPCRFVGPSPRP